MRGSKAPPTQPTAARPVAPDDLRAGSYVALLATIHEYLPLWRSDESWSGPMKIERYEWLPDLDDNECDVCRIVGVCTPYVLVKRPCGAHKTLDVRQCRLALLPDHFGRKAFAALAPKKEKSPRARRKRKKGTKKARKK